MSDKKSVKSCKKADGELMLKNAAVNALEQILNLARSDSTDSKTKYDIYKWLCEMHFGKPSSTASKSDNVEKALVLSFAGDLDKWSK